MADVPAIHDWPSNAELIRDVAQVGYLKEEWTTLDPTYGYGTFWKLWKPLILVATDLDPKKSPSSKHGQDFTDMPYLDQAFDAVVFDPPYKLNGTPDEAVDERSGVHKATRWQDRMKLILKGTAECARLAHEVLLVKCQDQVCSGKVRWQTDEVTEVAKLAGLRKVDRFDLLGGRPQPEGRDQKHARHNSSQLLVFMRKGSL